MKMKWDYDFPMPANREFEAYHLRDEEWNHFVFHSHAFWEIYFFVRGSVKIMAEDQLFDIQPWDMMIFPPGTMHKNIPVGRNCDYERAYFYVSDSFLRSVSRPEYNIADIMGKAMKNKRYHFHLTEEAGRDILRKIDEVIRNGSDLEVISQLINRCQMIIVVATVCGLIDNSTADHSAVAETKAAQILHYINLHFTESLSLDDLAGHFYISKYHLLREFKEYTGTTVHQYLIRKRIVYAQLLLQQGTGPMQAAQACGFADYAGFFRAFKRMTGSSPQEYAQSWHADGA